MTSHVVTAALAVAATLAVIGVAGLVLVVMTLNKEVR
jgi:hypothetical protein